MEYLPDLLSRLNQIEKNRLTENNNQYIDEIEIEKKNKWYPDKSKAKRAQSENQKNKIEEMSSSGVGNSFWGGLMANVVTEIGKNLLTPKELITASNKIYQRYIPVLNAPKGRRNSTPYLDVEINSFLLRYQTRIIVMQLIIQFNPY